MDELMRSREGFTELEALRRECEGGACVGWCASMGGCSPNVPPVCGLLFSRWMHTAAA